MPGKNNVFKDLLKPISRKKFDEIVEKYNGDKWCKSFFCWDLFIVLLRGQVTGEISMRSVELSNNCHITHLKEVDAKQVPLSTLSDACKARDPNIFMDVFWELLFQLKMKKKVDKSLGEFIHLIDSTPILLRGQGYEWVKSNSRIQGFKVHMVYDYDLKRPIHFSITDANVNDIEEGQKLAIESKGIYVFDRAYYDFKWWNSIDKKGSRFVTRAKAGLRYKIVKKHKVEDDIIHDWTIELSSSKSYKFKGLLRHIRIKIGGKKTIVIITNDHESSAVEIAALYKKRWEIELFFRWLKQNLKIKRFWGKNENAVKLQIITAMIAYILLQIAQIRSGCNLSIGQVRLIIRVNILSTQGIYKVLKIPDRAGTRRFVL